MSTNTACSDAFDLQEVVDLAVSGLVRDAEDEAVAGPNCAALRERPVEENLYRVTIQIVQNLPLT